MSVLNGAGSSSASHMSAVLLQRFLNASELLSLTFSPLARPHPLSTPLAAQSVVVKVVCAAISPSDVKNITGQMPHTTLPRIIGRDYSGIVVKAGEECQQWVGQAVYGTGGELGYLVDGSHAQYLCLPSSALAAKPKKLSFAAAAAVGVNFVTAYSGLHLSGHLTSSDTVLVTGASGGVGTAVKQLAKLAGAKVIAVDRTRPKETETHSSGQTQTATPLSVADYSLYLGEVGGFPGLPAAVSGLKLFDAESEDVHHVTTLHDGVFVPAGRGASLVFDVLGGDNLQYLLKCTASNGRLVNISTPAHSLVSIDLHDMYRRQVKLIGANSLYIHSSDSAAILNKLTPEFDSGRLLTSDSLQIIDLSSESQEAADSVGEAYQKVQKGAKGKVILRFHQDPN